MRSTRRAMLRSWRSTVGASGIQRMPGLERGRQAGRMTAASPLAKQLVAAALQLTTAKRHRVRVAAVEAVCVTMHQVGEAAARLAVESLRRTSAC